MRKSGVEDRPARPRATLRATLLACAVVVAACLGATALEAQEPVPVRLLGRLKTVAEGGEAFELSAKGGPYKLEVVTETAISLAAGKPFVECGGEAANLLARYEPSRRDPNSGTTLPPVYSQVLALIVGGPFSPPSDTTGLPSGVKWHQGTIRDEPKKNGPWVDGNQLSLGIDRVIWALAEAKRADLKKGSVLLVEGDVRKEGKAKVILARRAVIIAPTAPLAELKYLYGEFP